jgi:hypothetical protein
MSEKKRPRTQEKLQYTFEEDTAIVAQTVMNIARTTENPHPFLVALLEGYAQRIRTMYALPETPDLQNGK